MRAIVLAGGLGTRLRGEVPDLPKPMAPVAGRPFLEWVLDRLVAAGFGQAVLAVGYRFEAIRDHFGDEYRGLPLAYSVETSPLGTGGAMARAAGLAGPGPLFALNGDTFLDLDYRAMLAEHQRQGTRLTVAVRPVPDVARYGALELASGRITGFLEKGRAGPGVINAGVYLFATGLLHGFPPGEPWSFEQQLLMPRVAELRPVAFPVDGLFIDIGVPEDYRRAQGLFQAGGRG